MAQIQSGASADLLTIDPISKAARAALYDTDGNPLVLGANDQAQNPHGIVSMGMNDVTVLPMRLDRFGSQAQASHMPLLMEQFEGTTPHPIRWTISNASMTAAQTTAGGIVMNNAGTAAANSGYMIRSSRSYLRSLRQPLHAKFRARLWHFSNSVMELGFADAATHNGAITTGAYWQVTATGVVQPVLTFNGSDITGTDVRSLLDMNSFYTFDVFMDDDEVSFVIQDTETGELVSKQNIKLPATAQTLLSTTQIPVISRLYITATLAASPPQLTVTSIYVAMLDALNNAPQSHVMALMQRDATAHPHTGAQLATFANSATPSNATLSNTAASYTTLGGYFQFAAVAGAATDYALFGYTVPSPSTLVVTGISIETWNTGAAVATTPTLLVWGAMVNGTAVTLANTVGVRRNLGAQSLPVGAAVGAKAERIDCQFDTPLVCLPGRFLNIILRMPVGTATASQVIAGFVAIEGYFI